MPIPRSFIAGVLIAWTIIVTYVFELFQLCREADNTKTEALKILVNNLEIDWPQFITGTVISGVSGVVLWHGLKDTITMLRQTLD